MPLAFKNSVAQCRFEQGDVVYRNSPLGTIWAEEIKHIDFLIQVKSPSQTNSTATDNLDVFSSNWNSKIIFEKIYPNNLSKNAIIETTQGRFYSFLLTNDETFLTSDSPTLPVLTSILPKQINSNFIKTKIPANWCGFALIIDSVSDLLNSKRKSINFALEKNYNIKTEIFDLKESVILKSNDITSYSGISPTLAVELFLVHSDNLEEVQEILKDVLFKGSKDRFNINIHGQLLKN